MKAIIFNGRSYKECLKDFINGFGSDLGTPEMLNTEKETMWIKTLLYTIPAYVDEFLKNENSEYGYLETLITSKEAFTLRCKVGFVSVLIEYNLENRSSVYGCTFKNLATEAELFMQMVNGEFYSDLAGKNTTSSLIQRQIFNIFD